MKSRFICRERSQHTDVLASGYVLDGIINVETIEVYQNVSGCVPRFLIGLLKKRAGANAPAFAFLTQGKLLLKSS